VLIVKWAGAMMIERTLRRTMLTSAMLVIQRMRARSWRFARFEPAPASSNGGGVPDWAWTCPFANC
jgi:hypothetical protein